MKVLYWIALILVVIGAINWGLVGIWGFDLVSWLFVWKMSSLVAAQVVYIVIGVAGLYLLICSLFKGCCCQQE